MEIYIPLYTGVQGLATEKMRENIGNNTKFGQFEQVEK